MREVVPGSALSVQAGPGLGVDDARGQVDQEAPGTESAARVCGTRVRTHVPCSKEARLQEEAACAGGSFSGASRLFLSTSSQSDSGSRPTHLLTINMELHLSHNPFPLPPHDLPLPSHLLLPGPGGHEPQLQVVVMTSLLSDSPPQVYAPTPLPRGSPQLPFIPGP